MDSTTLDGLENSINQLRRESLSYRGAVNVLNSELAENRQALLTADAAAKANITTRNQQIRAELGLIRVRQQGNATLQATLQQERRELAGVTRGLGNTTRGTGILNRAVGELAGTLAGFGIVEAGFAILEFGRASVRASVQIDSQTRALAVLTGSLREAESAMRDVQELADLPGLRFQAAVDGTVALRAIGVEAETTTRILTELGNAAAFSGGQGEFERGLLGFRQLIQRGRLSQEELNQLTENIGLASRVLREEFGSVLAEDIQAQLDSTGQTIDDFVERTLQGFERLERFPLDAPAVKLKNFENSVLEFQAAVGDAFIPALASTAEGVGGFLDSIVRGVQELNDLSNATEIVTQAVFDTNASFDDHQSVVDYVASLQSLRDQQQSIIDQGNWWQYTADAQEGVQELTRWIDLYQEALSGVPGSQEALRAELEASTAQYDQQRQTRIDLLSQLNDESNSIFTNVGAIREQYDANEEAIAQTQAKIGILNQVLSSLGNVTEAEAEVSQAVVEASEAARLEAIVQNVLRDSYAQSADAAGQLATELGLLRETITENATQQEQLNNFWAAARGELTTYQSSVETLIPSLTNLELEQDALNTVIDENLTAYRNLTGGITSFAADQAIATAEINLVNPAISDAVDSIRSYNAVMTDAQGELRSVEDISETLTSSVRTQGTAFDELRGNVDRSTDAFGELKTRTDESSNAIDDFADALQPIPADVDLINDAFETFGDDTIAVLDVVNEALGETEGVLGAVASAFGEFADFLVNPVDFAGGFLAQITEALGQFGEFDGDHFEQGRVIQRFDGEGGFVGEPAAPADIQTIQDILNLEGVELPGEQFRDAFILRGLREQSHLLPNPEIQQIIRDAVPDIAAILFDQAGQPSGFTRFDPRPQTIAETLAPGSELGQALTDETVIAEMIADAVADAIQPDEAPDRTADFLQNALQRAQFGLTQVGSEEDFEEQRQNAIALTNAYFDAEDERIRNLGLSEDELRDQREDNTLARLRALDRLINLENSFTTERIRNEQRVAEEIARTAEAQRREAERTAEQQARADERAARDAERTAEAQRREAERAAETESRAQLDLTGNVVERAQFALDQSTDEASFEENRRNLAAATNQFYAAELERINGLMLSETELQNLREDNALERLKALTRINGLENTFATERMRNAQAALEEQQRLAEEQQRAAERQEEEDRRAQERAEADAQRAAEQATREQERQLEQAQREQERQAQAQRRAAQQEAQDQVNLRGNVVRRAQRTLDRSDSEAGFETNRQALIDATNEYYDLELERINGLDVSETRLQDLREDNAFEREGAIFRIQNLENEFTTERLDNEQMVRDSILEGIEERQREEGRAADERLRIAEREAREIERLQERQFASQQRLQQRGQDIQLGGVRSREDLFGNLRRQIEDTALEFGLGHTARTLSAPGRLEEFLIQNRDAIRESRFADGETGFETQIRDLFNVSPYSGFGDSLVNLLFEGTRGLDALGITDTRAREDLAIEGSREEMQFAMAFETASEGLETSASTAGESLETSAATAGTSLESAGDAVAQSLQQAASAIANAIASASRAQVGAGGGGLGEGFDGGILSDAFVSEFRDVVVRLQGQNRSL